MSRTPTPKSKSDDAVSVPAWNSDGVAARLKQVIGEQSVRSFCQDRGISATQLGEMLNGSRPRADKFVEIAQAMGVSMDWLATGREFGGNQPDLGPEFVKVPRYDVTASFGPGALIDRERILDYMAFREDWVRQSLHADPKDLALISGDGDSMEPTIRPGDLLLINLGIRRFVNDAIYAIVVRGELKVKRLQQLMDGSLMIRSDNTNYEPEKLPADQVDDLHVAGRVIWIARNT